MKALAFTFLMMCISPALAQPSGLKELQHGAAGSVGFKGIPLGIGGAELVESLPWIDCGVVLRESQICSLAPKNCFPDTETYDKCTQSMTYGGVPLKTADFTLFAGRVAMVHVKIDTLFFDRLKDSMALAFGKPSKVETTLIRTAASGAELLNDHHHWTRGDGLISVSRYGLDIGHALVTIVDQPALTEIERRRRLDVEAGAKDL